MDFRANSAAGRNRESSGKFSRGGARSVEERFWEKVNKTESCWLWTASRSDGYGRFSVDGVQVLAHRYCWELLGNPIPSEGWYHPIKNPGGAMLDHDGEFGCGEPSCVNPAHLELVPNKKNLERRRGSYGASGVRNVYWVASASKWMVRVTHDGKQHYFGIFSDLGEAELVAIEARKNLFGDQK